MILPPPTPPSPLRAARLAQGLRLAHVAYAAGVTISQVSRWERGLGCPPASAVCLLAEIYGLSEGEIARWFAVEAA